jgi:hypothetical protein
MVNLPQLTTVWSLLTIRCFPSVVSKQKIGFSVFFQRVAYCTKAMVSSVLAITYLASHILSLATLIQKQRRHPFVMSDTGGEWFLNYTRLHFGCLS